MNKPQKDVMALLDEHATKIGFSKGHPKYQLRSGHIFVTPAPTHSKDGCPRAWLNSRADLRRLLGLTPVKSDEQVVTRKNRKQHSPRKRPATTILAPTKAPRLKTFHEALAHAAFSNLKLRDTSYHPSYRTGVRHTQEHGKVRSLTAYEIAAANVILWQFGEEAYHTFLKDRDPSKFNLRYKSEEDPLKLIQQLNDKKAALTTTRESLMTQAAKCDDDIRLIDSELAKPLSHVNFEVLQKLVGAEALVESKKGKGTARVVRQVALPKFRGVRDTVRAIYCDTPDGVYGPEELLALLIDRDRSFEDMKRDQLLTNLYNMKSADIVAQHGNKWGRGSKIVVAQKVNGHAAGYHATA